MTTGKGKCMKVHSLLKSLNAIDEEMIAEADRFAVKRREQLKSRQHIFVTEVTAVAAIAIAVAGVFFFSLQPGHTPQKQSGQNGVLLDDTQTKTTAKADEEMKTTAEETQELVKIALAPAVYTQDMVEYIKAVSNEWIEHFEMYSQTEYIDDAEFFIMEPFQTWNKTPSGETCSEGDVLPVVYENQVICTVMLYQVDNSWHYSLSSDLCKELNELINYSGQARIVYEFDDNGTYIQTALLYDENGNDAKGITVLLTLTAGDELSSSR